MKTAKRTTEKATEKTIFRHQGWSVVRNEDGDYEVRDQDDDVVETFTDARTAAIEAFRSGAEDTYPNRLWWAVQDVFERDYDDRVKLETVKQVAALLGIDADEV